MKTTGSHYNRWLLDAFPVEFVCSLIDCSQEFQFDPLWERTIHANRISRVDRLGGRIDRLDNAHFYAAIQSAFAIVATSDPTLYGNIVLTKGARGV